MAAHDLFLPPEPMLKAIVTENPQGELISRFVLRQLPMMKSGPEDDIATFKPTRH